MNIENIENMIRLNSLSDFIIPPVTFYMFWLYRERKLNKLIFTLCYISFFLAIFVSYSRYLWLFFSVSTLLGLLNTKFSSVKKAFNHFFLRFLLFVISVMIASILMKFYMSIDVISFIVERFSGSAATSSDDARKEMFNALIPFFLDSILYGHGMGSYPNNFIRFVDTPWNYELQWLAIISQFGIIGFLLILTPIARLVSNIVNSKCCDFFNKTSLLVIIGFWCAVGLINCFLIASSAGVIHLTYFLISMKLTNDFPKFHRI